MKNKTENLAPINAKTFNQICSLNTDNEDCVGGWITIDQDSVYLENQEDGKKSTGSVSFKRRDFNKLVRWYTREQKIVRRVLK